MASPGRERPWRLLFSLHEVVAGLTPNASRGLATGLDRAAVRVDLRPEGYGRAPHATDGDIARIWEAKAKEGARLFDGAKYRLAAVRAAGGTCELCIGRTGYREYIGTHTGPNLDALERDGLANRGDGRAHLSCALGVEALFETADGHAVLLRRSDAVATHAGMYNGPSGHPEPDHAVDSGAVAAGDELFEAVRQETHEETNVPLEDIGEPRLIGAMVDERLKPDLVFHLRTPLSAAAVRARYAAGAPEGWESAAMVTVPPRPGGGWHVDGLALTPVTQAALACASAMAALARV